MAAAEAATLEAEVAPARDKAAPAPAAAAEAAARPPTPQATTREDLRRPSSHRPSWRLSWLYPVPRSRSSWMQQEFHTVLAFLTRTCAPRERLRPGRLRSSVPRKMSSLFQTESKPGCSTASIYLRRGGRRRGAPRSSRFSRPAVTRHGPWIRDSAAASSTSNAQSSFVLPSDFRRPSKRQQPLQIKSCPRVSRPSFVPHLLPPATRTATSHTNKGSGDSARPQPSATR